MSDAGSRFLTAAEVRAYDAAAIARGVPGVLPMENAGRGVADLMTAKRIGGEVVVLCGKGNNGGDGLVIARHWQSRGGSVRIELAFAPELFAGDAGVMWKALNGLAIPWCVFDGNRDALVERLRSADCVVDALLGTGTAGAIREPFVGMIEAIDAAGKPTVAVDLPSGLDADSGTPLGPCVRAQWTATFVALKAGFRNPASCEYTGDIHVLDIGAGRVE